MKYVVVVRDKYFVCMTFVCIEKAWERALVLCGRLLSHYLSALMEQLQDGMCKRGKGERLSHCMAKAIIILLWLTLLPHHY